MPTKEGAWLEDGVWKPWRHPDYRSRAHDCQGWWRKATGEVIAVLGAGDHSSAGNELVTCAKYDFNQGTRGTGFRMRRSALELRFERAPDDLDPRQ
jgi:hypothetical protein